LKGRHLYRFEKFALIADENVLQRDGVGVPLTPKMYEMLLVLVRNHGQIVEKETLFKEVWPDSFVEEGNIAFNIRQLRKALEDDAQAPTYIETVPRRGYRFIAQVEEILAEPILDPGSDSPPETMTADDGKRQRTFLAPFAAVILLFAFAAAFGFWYLYADRNTTLAPLLTGPFSSEKLSTTGMTYTAAISPNGKTVVYPIQNAGRQSVWLRQLDSGNNTEIIPPSDDKYFEFTFSPDGDSIYFSRGKDGPDGHIDIYRVSILGGIPEKVANATQGWLSISPDGQRISFVRCDYRDDEYCSLWIADSKDGKNERKLLGRPRPIRIGDNKISPDGTKIAFAFGQSRNQANEFRLQEVEIETGIEREITAERFFNIKSLAWLPDQTGLLLTSSRIPNKYFRIWEVASASGAAEPLTKDSETYSALSLDKGAARLVSTQVKQDFRIHLFEMNNPSKGQVLADAIGASFGPDGKIFFTSTMSGNDEIWSINADGSGRRQLTNDPADERKPVVAPDGNSVYFTSNRTGEAHIWRMNADGSNQEQITKTEGGFPLFVSRDAKLIYYQHAISGTLWSVSIDGRVETLVLNTAKRRFSFSPDGAHLAFEQEEADGSALTIFSVTDKKELKTLKLPNRISRTIEIEWTPDGRSLLCVVNVKDSEENILYLQPVDGGNARQVIDLGDNQTNETLGLAASPDGTKFLVIQGAWKHDVVLINGLK
jgi:Tol biopolymer transport system component/DNA-binding winged helix-turn-helix (wHTH) protein